MLYEVITHWTERDGNQFNREIFREQDRDKLIELFSHLEFKTWLREVQSGDSAKAVEAAEVSAEDEPPADPASHP